jgi:hypothetical protein
MPDPDTDFAQGIVADILDAVAEEAERLGAEIAADVRESIDIPVEPTSSGYVVRSRPGEPPRRESGHLWESIGFEVARDDGRRRVGLSVYSDDPKAAGLEYGRDDVRPRPFMAPAFDRWADQVAERIADAATSATIK